MRTVEDFSRLWDGSEPGWVVVRHSEDRETLLVRFGAGGPTVPEVKALREIANAFSGMAAAEVFSTLRGKTEFDFGDFESSEARELRKRCEELGLKTTGRGYQAVSHSLVNELSKVFLLIEDTATSQAVAEEAIRQGLPLRQSVV